MDTHLPDIYILTVYKHKPVPPVNVLNVNAIVIKREKQCRQEDSFITQYKRTQ